jgi:hypothetical protein
MCILAFVRRKRYIAKNTIQQKTTKKTKTVIMSGKILGRRSSTTRSTVTWLRICLPIPSSAPIGKSSCDPFPALAMDMGMKSNRIIMKIKASCRSFS